jgi:hypothetical protein
MTRLKKQIININPINSDAKFNKAGKEDKDNWVCFDKEAMFPGWNSIVGLPLVSQKTKALDMKRTLIMTCVLIAKGSYSKGGLQSFKIGRILSP